MAGQDEDLAGLTNLGPVIAGRLRAAGVETPAQLREMGAVEAYVRLRRVFPDHTTEVVLYALYGALAGVRWYELGDAVRAALRDAASRRS